MRAASLVDVLPAAAASIGSPLVDGLDPLGEFSHVVVVLIDGLGALNLSDAASIAPRLQGGDVIRTVFPSTTPAGLGSLGTALPPGVHGLVAASFIDPDTDQLVTPLHWGSEPHPIAFQPHATVFERLARQGVTVNSVGPAEYERSGLTSAVLRGSAYHAAENRAERVDHVRTLAGTPGLTYVYWSALDRVGHVHGWQSEEWHGALRDVDQLIDELRSAMPASAGLVVTADHGMVDVVTRVELDENEVLRAGVHAVCGEPRARLVYAVDGAADDVALRWRSELGSYAEVYDATQFGSLYGELDPDVMDRLPDVIAVAKDGVILASDRVDRRVSGLIGQHGGRSERETQIPLIVL